MRKSLSKASKAEKFLQGVALFNAGKFFRAHEAWEELWLTSSGTDKLFLQGLIQTAAALHHLSRGNSSGAKSLLEAGCAKLARLPDDFWGIKLGNLVKDSRALLTRLKERSEVMEKFPRIELKRTGKNTSEETLLSGS